MARETGSHAWRPRLPPRSPDRGRCGDPISAPRPIIPSKTLIELAHTPELAILIALDTLLEMTAVTIHLSLPELDLVQRGHELRDPDFDDRDLVVAQDILDLVGALRHTIRIYRDLGLCTPLPVVPSSPIELPRKLICPDSLACLLA